MRTYLQNAFELFSLALQPPMANWMDAVVTGELANQMAETWKELELPEEDISEYVEGMQQYVGRDKEEVRHELACEATRLHYGDGQLVRNTEGLWRLHDEGREGVFIINHYAREVSDFMHECGVVRVQGYNDSMDSIENECYFMSILASSPQYLIDADRDPQKLFDQFMEEHMKKWVPGYCKEMQEMSRLVYYKATCRLFESFIRAF